MKQIPVGLEKKIAERTSIAMKEHVTPGGVVGIITRDGERAVLPFGRLTYDGSAPRVTEETLYDVASVTKSIPGACVILRLVDEGRISLDDPLVKYIPEFGTSPDKRTVTVRHMLTYTIDMDLPATSSLAYKSVEEIVSTVLRAPLRAIPGTVYKYTNATALLIHMIAGLATGRTLPELADEYFFNPLGMTRTTFFPKKFSPDEIAPTEIVPSRGGEVRGVVHDESTHKLQEKFVPAIAGLFSTVPDLLTFSGMLLKEGAYGGRNYFSPSIIREMYTNQFPGSGFSVGLGFEFNEEYFMGKYAKDTFGKGGFTGTAVMVNPSLGVAFVFLSNAIYPKRPPNADARKALRRDLADIIFGAFVSN